MAAKLLVESHIDDGRRLIEELGRDGFEVTAAFWAKTADEGLWHLYIASPSVQQGNVGDAYITAFECLERAPNSSVSLSDIKLVPASKPAAIEAAAIRDREPRRSLPTRFHGNSLGNLSIEEAYIYPRVTGGMARDEVLQAVASLMNRSGLVPPATVTFRDGSTIKAVPIGVQVPQPGKVQFQFHDVSANSTRTVDAEDVTSIR